MAIYKSKHASNYTVLPNEVFKSKLSIEAIGLLAYFLSLPADWVIYKTTLHEQLNIGRDKLNTIFNELRDAGYLISVEKRDGGKISYEHIVYDKPYNGEPSTEKPLTEKPSTVEPSTENMPLLNTNKQSTNILSKDILNKDNTYQLAVDFWLKDFRQGWTFSGIHGKHLKDLLGKFRKINPNGSEEDIVLMFEYFCRNLPDWFKDKDLPVLNSKFNEIITQIKTQKNGITKKSKFNKG